MPIPVISTAQMREWERATWATGQNEAEVIRRVNEKVTSIPINWSGGAEKSGGSDKSDAAEPSGDAEQKQ